MKRNHIILGALILALLIIIPFNFIYSGESKAIKEFREMSREEILKIYDTNKDGFLDHDEKDIAHNELGIDKENCIYETENAPATCPFKEKGFGGTGEHDE